MLTTGGTALASFITLSGSTIAIAPTLQSQVGTYSLSIAITDGLNSPVSSLTVVINANQIPTLTAPLTTQTVVVGLPGTYTIPSFADPEGDTVSIN